jgi:hypothetical protein
MVDFCEYSYASSVSMKKEELFDYLNDYFPLKKDSSLWSSLEAQSHVEV